MKTCTIAIILSLCCIYSGIVFAHGYNGYRGHIGHHNHANFGFYFSSPIYPHYNQFYPSPYYFPPEIVTVPVTPPVYIQQAPALQRYPSGYWYYCNDPEGYYPYVKDCPNGWQQVSPVPH